MNDDRYESIARALAYFGWIQDFMLRRARMHAVEALHSRGVKTVLDACCGAGTLSRYLSRAGMTVTGVDLSPSMLRLAKARAPDARFLEADVARLQLKERVDGSIVALSLHEMSEEHRSVVWNSMRRLTRKGGPLIVLDYTSLTNPTLFSRMAQRFIQADEHGIDKDDPGHFQNFTDFMSVGGAAGWLALHRETILSESHFLFGNLGVLAVDA